MSFSQQVFLGIRSLVMVCVKMRQNKAAILTCMQALLNISIWDKFISVKCPLMSILWVLRTNLETNPRLACLRHREDLGEPCLCCSPAAPQRRGPLSRVSSRQGSLCWFPIERCSRKAWEILPITWNSYIQDFFLNFETPFWGHLKRLCDFTCIRHATKLLISYVMTYRFLLLTLITYSLYVCILKYSSISSCKNGTKTLDKRFSVFCFKNTFNTFTFMTAHAALLV